MKVPGFLRLSFLAVFLWGANFLLSLRLQIDMEKISQVVLFLLGLYSLSHFTYVFIKRKKPGNDVFIYLALLLIKFMFVFLFLIFFLNPKILENKYEVILFLMNYFVFLTFDVSWKVKSFEGK